MEKASLQTRYDFRYELQVAHMTGSFKTFNYTFREILASVRCDPPSRWVNHVMPGENADNTALEVASQDDVDDSQPRGNKGFIYLPKKRKGHKKKSQFTREVKMAVIEEVRLENVLWDTTHEDCYRKEHMAKAYERIVEKLKLRDILVSTEEAHKIFSNLRTQYQAERKREAETQERVSGSKRVYTSKWEYLDSLTFLDDSIKHEKSISSIDSPSSTSLTECLPETGLDRLETGFDRLATSMECTLQALEHCPGKGQKR